MKPFKPFAPMLEENCLQVGLIALGAGLAGLGVFVLLPVYQAHREVQSFEIYRFWIAMSILLLISGFNLAATGRRGFGALLTGSVGFQDLPARQKILFFISIIFGAAGYYILVAYLESSGYVVSLVRANI